jgi:hypothetical protein
LTRSATYLVRMADLTSVSRHDPTVRPQHFRIASVLMKFANPRQSTALCLLRVNGLRRRAKLLFALSLARQFGVLVRLFKGAYLASS